MIPEEEEEQEEEHQLQHTEIEDEEDDTYEEQTLTETIAVQMEDDDEEEEDLNEDEDETTFDDEEAVAAEAVTEQDGQDEDEIFDDDDPQDDADAFSEVEETLSRTLDDRTGTTTDDEISSVDRMELADAYDEGGESTTGGDDGTALTSAGGDDDDDHEDDATPAADENENENDVTSDCNHQVAADEISEEQKRILIQDLKFKPRDVQVLRPDIAALVISKGLCRPEEGMPANWYVEGASPPKVEIREKAAKLAIALVVLGVAAAVGVHGGLALGSVKDFATKVPSAFATLPSLFTSRKTTNDIPAVATPASTVASTPTLDAERPADTNEDQPEEKDDNKAHSIKPNSDFTALKNENWDKTWLDRLITKFENAIKAFLNIKI